MYKLLVRIIIVGMIMAVVWWWYKTPDAQQKVISSSVEDDAVASSEELLPTQQVSQERKQQHGEQQEKREADAPTYTYDNHVKNTVPFIVQAPLAQWSDERFQDACEEASLLMAHRWRSGERGLSKNDATEALVDMFKREKTFFDDKTIDTSAKDTARFGEDYFGGSFLVQNDIALDDIYQALSDGAIVIVPTNGQKLGNPHFRGEGPQRHMLVITGYDYAKKEFITNDPGTRKGKNYRYNTAVLYNAIRDYPTGHKVPITDVRKAMIVVKK